MGLTAAVQRHWVIVRMDSDYMYVWMIAMHTHAASQCKDMRPSVSIQ